MLMVPFISLSTAAGALLLVALGLTALLSLMLYYHWVRWGVGLVGTFTVMIVYAGGVVVLALTALGLYQGMA